MILAKTEYKMDNNKFLAIIEAFKTYQKYLKNNKYMFFLFINYKILYQFIAIKSINFY